jgi:hypothetical protein
MERRQAKKWAQKNGTCNDMFNILETTGGARQRDARVETQVPTRWGQQTQLSHLTQMIPGQRATRKEQSTFHASNSPVTIGVHDLEQQTARSSHGYTNRRVKQVKRSE